LVINLIYQILRTARPRQWLKNLSVFAAPVFSGRLLEPGIFIPSLEAFFIFSMVSSGAYFVNDIIDAPKDRTHPIKKNRPIASGKLSEKTAWVAAFLLILGAVILAATFVGSFFTLAIIFYILLQLFYSTYLRNIIIIDSLAVATGFVIRVFAGGFAAFTSLSSWLVLATIGLSLLLAFGKRRSEKTILRKHLKPEQEADTRKTLRHYPDSLLDSMISMSSTFAIITYSLFAFQVSPQDVSPVISNVLPSILKSPKWMMLTIPIVIYGVARYLYVIYEREDAESPERVLLSDKPLLLTVLLWSACIFFVIYLIPLVGS
ncbi:MAG TPA: decaprenyl-phosphate phosphoribosyltransferase, partial [Patescibacteria group bacterium]|nr:decaprenyl-phosphate phosphoribosyltransferase [Patescibacteria group bacterium]